jgi:hypothetical protein
LMLLSAKHTSGINCTPALAWDNNYNVSQTLKLDISCMMQWIKRTVWRCLCFWGPQEEVQCLCQLFVWCVTPTDGTCNVSQAVFQRVTILQQQSLLARFITWMCKHEGIYWDCCCVCVFVCVPQCITLWFCSFISLMEHLLAGISFRVQDLKAAESSKLIHCMLCPAFSRKLAIWL